jgi:hypothetical protein
VFDAEGRVRERLSWPLPVPPVDRWQPLNDVPIGGDRIVAFRFTGHAAAVGTSPAQTLLSAFRPGIRAPLWIGLSGPDQRLTAILEPEPGRSPHYWLGPAVEAGSSFDIQLLVHPGMGPGGLLYRLTADAPWSSLSAASAWGAERLHRPERWTVGHGQQGPDDRAFLGRNLAVSATTVEG